MATFNATACRPISNQTNIQPVYDIYASVARPRSRQRVRRHRARSSPTCKKQLKPGNTIQVLGQIQSMQRCLPRPWHRTVVCGRVRLSAHGRELPEFRRSVRRDPGAAGDLLRHLTMLFITGTTLSVPSLMGAIMAVGVASANSILLVTFAREQQLAGKTRASRLPSSGPHPHPPGADDGGGDDRRHDPDGDRRRRRGAERGAGARRHRRARCSRPRPPCWSSHICLQCCASATTARRHMAYSRN